MKRWKEEGGRVEEDIYTYNTHTHTVQQYTQYTTCLISAPQYPQPRVNHVSMYEEEGRVADFYFVFHDTATTPFRLKTTAKC